MTGLTDYQRGQTYALDFCVGLMRVVHDNDPGLLCPDELGHGTCSLCTAAGAIFDQFGWEE